MSLPVRPRVVTHSAAIERDRPTSTTSNPSDAQTFMVFATIRDDTDFAEFAALRDDEHK
jgi:hypothetical protein